MNRFGRRLEKLAKLCQTNLLHTVPRQSELPHVGIIYAEGCFEVLPQSFSLCPGRLISQSQNNQLNPQQEDYFRGADLFFFFFLFVFKPSPITSFTLSSLERADWTLAGLWLCHTQTLPLVTPWNMRMKTVASPLPLTLWALLKRSSSSELIDSAALLNAINSFYSTVKSSVCARMSAARIRALPFMCVCG